MAASSSKMLQIAKKTARKTNPKKISKTEKTNSKQFWTQRNVCSMQPAKLEFNHLTRQPSASPTPGL
jgi:hypothetical protein